MESNSKNKDKQIIFKRLNDLEFINLGKGTYISSPSKLHLTNLNFNVKEWVGKNLLNDLPQDYKYLIKFATIIDLRNVFSERVISIRGKTLFEALQENDKFIIDLLLILKKEDITIDSVIKNSTIDLLIDDNLTKNELEKIRENSNIIMENLSTSHNNKFIYLTDLFNLDLNKTNEILKGYCTNYESVSNQIINNAKFWNNFLGN